RTGLGEDLAPGEGHHLLGHVRVTDPALGGREVLRGDRQVGDRVLQAVLHGTEVGPVGGDRLDGRVEGGDGRRGAVDQVETRGAEDRRGDPVEGHVQRLAVVGADLERLAEGVRLGRGGTVGHTGVAGAGADGERAGVADGGARQLHLPDPATDVRDGRLDGTGGGAGTGQGGVEAVLEGGLVRTGGVVGAVGHRDGGGGDRHTAEGTGQGEAGTGEGAGGATGDGADGRGR